jgi:hypothetical protein
MEIVREISSKFKVGKFKVNRELTIYNITMKKRRILNLRIIKSEANFQTFKL